MEGSIMIEALYEKDFYAWAKENARLMREGRLSDIDIEHIAEELESMTRSEKRELISRLAVLMSHLLKWQFQQEKRSNSWKNTIDAQREDVSELLEDSPSLRHEIGDKLQKAYSKAKLLVAAETGMARERFPATCPYDLDQVLSEEFSPE